MKKNPKQIHRAIRSGKRRRETPPSPSLPSTSSSACYDIRVKGHLDARWETWFDGMRIATKDDETVIFGDDIDQPKLRGILNKIWDLNLTLVSVRRLAAKKRGGNQ
ncbi:hypothetical protein ANRL1_01453 [Anaerolineae bacterium]|nr:hypothetical protein ANRL1_01453 [Anaerolineae bacterium]